MEKLKAKHDHKLTDILKVFIFGLILIMPGIIMLPSMLYYSVNEYATAPTTNTEIYEERQVDFNQKLQEFDETYWNKAQNSTTFIDGVCTLLVSHQYNRVETQCNLIANNKYYISVLVNGTSELTNNDIRIASCNNSFGPIVQSMFYLPVSNNGFKKQSIIFTPSLNAKYFDIIDMRSSNWDAVYLTKPMVINLTQMYGSGNEPTKEQFEAYYTNSYYSYTESKLEIITINTGETETYTDITSQIQYNWTSLWKQPLFNWTNYTILKQGIDNFTNVFGITNQSNISNLIAYELIMVAIYIVIDIVITLFKWLTHLIGSK